ncbi:hypothetical protein [Acinetobacter equi]|uniref:hypothetical protein n=1 Tax=Acinetobacter equi TaxID=1324350 RepID=UPI000A8F0020|nr:hypothetical protein [Acinetobacter equi]
MNKRYQTIAAILSSTFFMACGDKQNNGIEKNSAKISCGWNTSVQLSYEERRLETPLPFSGENVVGNDKTPLATRMINAGGFNQLISNFKQNLCNTNGLTEVSNFEQAKKLVSKSGQELWSTAVDRAQGRSVIKGNASLPASDDRILYWVRVQMTKALRQWNPKFILTAAEKEELQWIFEKASRGQNSIDLPEGKNADGRLYRRMIISGFDVFSLGQPGEPNTGLRNGNPSAAVALALDGKEFILSDGSILHIESYILPVNYDPFTKGMQEDTLGPWFKAGPKRVDASITLSQGGNSIFNLEQYNARFHGSVAGNDGMAYCLSSLPKDTLAIGKNVGDGVDLISLKGSGCNIVVPERWFGSDTASEWKKDSPPQFTIASFPHKKMLEDHSQLGILRPMLVTGEGLEGFDVTWNTYYEYFPDCSKPETQGEGGHEVVNKMPNMSLIKDPVPEWCSRNGSGGDYLSNESAYRNTLLRDVMRLKIPAGHIHVPVMNNFDGVPNVKQDDNAITTAIFESYRTAIIGQTTNLLKIIGESLVEK